jgi:hypothetical protein
MVHCYGFHVLLFFYATLNIRYFQFIIYTLVENNIVYIMIYFHIFVTLKSHF